MNRVLIISNRLPVKIEVKNDKIEAQQSVGGLATGMSSIHENSESKWIGWPGINKGEYGKETTEQINKELDKLDCVPVYLTKEDLDGYYNGFSNNTIWPLYHYFTQFAEYEQETWESYVKVNEIFAEEVQKIIKPGDYVWVHDYHLQLLPKMIKDKNPDVTIGYFLHIPFPSYEVFRILPWRNEIIEGLLGADLLGFHTFDYERHFLSSVRRLLGYDIEFNTINFQNRIVKVDAFPMGIDYDKFNNAAQKQQQKSLKDKSELQKELERHYLNSPDRKIILSIDRLDYSKGIANRLEAYEYFLDHYPEYKEKVTLVMVAVPSRSEVEHYQTMKREVDELVGRINGKFSSVNWTPVWYFYRMFQFESLIDLYINSEIGLLTPIRDGMNLVAKEYVAAKVDKKGVLILSEMAGAAKEMSEALIINPNNYEEISQAIIQAYNMSEEEQVERNDVIQKRLNRYNVKKWAKDFFDSLKHAESLQSHYFAKKLSQSVEKQMLDKFKKSEKRILFLDYDGTLVDFQPKPESAEPDQELYEILDKLSKDPKNEIVLISGRDRETFSHWFSNKNLTLIVEHGVWLKKGGDDWRLIEQRMNSDWKALIRPALEFYVDRTPGTFIEEKNYSLVWHYRRSDPELGLMRAIELKDELTSLITNHNIEILEGNKVVEIKNSGVNKGMAALKILDQRDKTDFILGIGDDWTDEYLFEELPQDAHTIKVGIKPTRAKYNLESFNQVRELLKKLIND